MMWLILAALAADPTVSLPPAVVARPGRLVQIAAKTDCKLIRWYLAGDDADLIVMESTRSAIFSAMAPGRYKILAWTAAGDIPSEPAVCVVTVGSAPPVPPGPVAPTDPLTLALKGLLEANQDPDKLKQLAALADVYRRAGRAATDPEIKTAGDLFAFARRQAVAVLPPMALEAIRARLGEELAAVLPMDPDAALTPSIRTAATEIYNKLAEILESLK